MIKKFFLLFPIFFFSLYAYCQSEVYKNGIGVVLGLNSGVSFKHTFIHPAGDVFITTSSGELLLTTGSKGVAIGGLYGLNIASDYKSSFVWNVGGGIRSGIYNKEKQYFLIGVLATIGTEYIFEAKPFSIGLNYIPFFDLKGQDNSYVDFMLSVRYLFYKK